jgi:hypothetical protein
MIWSTSDWEEPLSKAKPFSISKRVVWEAYSYFPPPVRTVAIPKDAPSHTELANTPDE